MAKLQKDVMLASYKEILIEVGRNLAKRKGQLALRSFLIIWPWLVVVGFMTFLNPHDPSTQNYFSSLSDQGATIFLIGLLAWLVFTGIYICFMRLMFEVEKHIWVDSYFDKKDLTGRESWRITWRLFGPIAELCGRIFWRFLLFPLIVWGIAMYWDVVYLVSVSGRGSASSYLQSDIPIWHDPVLMGMVAGFIISAILAVYCYTVSLRLRFVWFIFLDNYGTEQSSTKAIIEEQDQLNKAAESIGLKRAIATGITSSLVSVIATFVSDMVLLGALEVSRASGSKSGQAVLKVVQTYSREVINQASSLGHSVAIYILYKESRKAAGQKEIVVNEHLYKLAK